MGSTPDSCWLCFSISRIGSSLTALPTSVDSGNESRCPNGHQGQDRARLPAVVGSRIIEARTAPGAVNGFLELGPLGIEANTSKAQEDETEDGLRVLCSLKVGVGAELIGSIP